MIEVNVSDLTNKKDSSINNKKDSYNENHTKLVIPKTLITHILNLAHDSVTSAHLGFKRPLIKKMKNYFC